MVDIQYTLDILHVLKTLEKIYSRNSACVEKDHMYMYMYMYMYNTA